MPRFAKKSQQRRLRAPCASSRLRNSLTPIQTSPQPLLSFSLCSLPSTPPPTHREEEKVITKGAQGSGASKGGRPGWSKSCLLTPKLPLAHLHSHPRASKNSKSLSHTQLRIVEKDGGGSPGILPQAFSASADSRALSSQPLDGFIAFACKCLGGETLLLLSFRMP